MRQIKIVFNCMVDKKICIEYELSCKSANIIWPLISTPSGLARWVADTVKFADGVFTFTWGELHGHSDTRTATLIEKKDFSHMRLRWDEDEYDDSTYLELKLEKGDITDDFILVVTDFAPDGDVDDVREIWSACFNRLHHSTGL